MGFWIHLKRSLDQAMLHKDRCLEVPSAPTSSDFWEGSWEEYPTKERALDALEQTEASHQLKCPLCKP